MTDQRFTELLGKQLADELSQDESVELKATLADHPERNAEYDLLQSYFKSGAEEDENIDFIFDRIKARIKTKSSVLHPSLSKSYKVWVRIAAVVAILFAAGLVFYNRSTFLNKNANSPSLITLAKATEIKTIVLADGSIVKINSGSSLKYPAAFNAVNRVVYLSGEAFFSVKKDAKHPFIVYTNQLTVKVLGTAFNVKAYANDRFTETTLIRGSVAISLKDEPSKKYILKPNDKFTYSDGKPQLSILSHFNGAMDGKIVETAWTNHELLFKNDSFAEVAKLFERWYGIKILIENPELKAIKFTGNFNKESVIEALNALKIIEPFNYSMQGRNVYIYR
ncbi:transmembrane sensor [Pedobacter sp. UYEF25]